MRPRQAFSQLLLAAALTATQVDGALSGGPKIRRCSSAEAITAGRVRCMKRDELFSCDTYFPSGGDCGLKFFRAAPDLSKCAPTEASGPTWLIFMGGSNLWLSVKALADVMLSRPDTYPHHRAGGSPSSSPTQSPSSGPTGFPTGSPSVIPSSTLTPSSSSGPRVAPSTNSSASPSSSPTTPGSKGPGRDDNYTYPHRQAPRGSNTHFSSEWWDSKLYAFPARQRVHDEPGGIDIIFDTATNEVIHSRGFRLYKPCPYYMSGGCYDDEDTFEGRLRSWPPPSDAFKINRAEFADAVRSAARNRTVTTQMVRLTYIHTWYVRELIPHWQLLKAAAAPEWTAANSTLNFVSDPNGRIEGGSAHDLIGPH